MSRSRARRAGRVATHAPRPRGMRISVNFARRGAERSSRSAKGRRRATWQSIGRRMQSTSRAAEGGGAAVALYRALARLGRTCDRDPTLKALLSARPTSQYDHETQRWSAVDAPPQRGLHALAARFLGGSQYRPEASLGEFVRNRFREPVRSRRHLADRLDAAFAALAHLNMHVSRSSELTREIDGEGAASAVTDARGHVAGGSILISHPLQLDPSFGRSLLLMTSHETSGASAALIVNKRSALRLADISRLASRRAGGGGGAPAGASRAALGPLGGNYVHVGGPVPTPLLALHCFPPLLDEAKEARARAGKRGASGEAKGAADAEAEEADAEAEAEAWPSLEGRVHCGVEGGVTPDGGGDGTRRGALTVQRADAQFLAGARALIDAGVATASDFKLVLGSVGWGNGQLEGEVCLVECACATWNTRACATWTRIHHACATWQVARHDWYVATASSSSSLEDIALEQPANSSAKFADEFTGAGREHAGAASASAAGSVLAGGAGAPVGEADGDEGEEEEYDYDDDYDEYYYRGDDYDAAEGDEYYYAEVVEEDGGADDGGEVGDGASLGEASRGQWGGLLGGAAISALSPPGADAARTGAEAIVRAAVAAAAESGNNSDDAEEVERRQAAMRAYGQLRRRGSDGDEAGRGAARLAMLHQARRQPRQ